MAVKATENTKPESAAVKDTTDVPRSEPVEAEPKTEPRAAAAPGECVVDDGTPHTGRATLGAVICSAHAIHYKADGTRREP